MHKHVRSNGWLMYYPEGRLNRENERTLQPFRFGGFQTVHELDMEVWGFAHTGSSEFWPADGVGGLPATISCALFPIFPHGAQAHVKASEGEGKEEGEEEEEEEETHKMLARDAQAAFQEKVDAIWAERDKETAAGKVKCKDQ